MHESDVFSGSWYWIIVAIAEQIIKYNLHVSRLYCSVSLLD